MTQQNSANKSGAIFSVINNLWQICLFKQTPESLPYSTRWVLALVVLHTIVMNLGIDSSKVAPSQLFLPLILRLVVLFGAVYLLLKFYQKTPRFIKTIFAILGTGLIIAVLGNFIFWLFASISPDAFLIKIAILGLNIWNLIITGYIFSKALLISTGQGVLWALLISVLEALPIVFALQDVIVQANQ